MCQILDGLDGSSVVPRHQHKNTIYLELMQKVTLEKYSQPRSDSFQHSQNSYSNKKRLFMSSRPKVSNAIIQ